MAKRQTRRSISVSRPTYERLRAYCETNGISMSQFVEHRVGDFLGRSIRRPEPVTLGAEERPVELAVAAPRTPVVAMSGPAANSPTAHPPRAVVATATPAASAPRPAPAAPPSPAKLTPDRIFTF